MTEEALYPTEGELEEARARARQKIADQMVAVELQVEPEIPRRGAIPIKNEPIYQVTLDLAEHTAQIVIDGKIYQHGGTYKVPERAWHVMREMIARGWEHQREIEGKDRNVYREKRNLTIGPQHLTIPSEKLFR